MFLPTTQNELEERGWKDLQIILVTVDSHRDSLFIGAALIGRGRERHVDFPYGTRPDYCKLCRECVTLCPMSVTPCDGPFKPGQERLCGKCESQFQSEKYSVEDRIRCDLDRSFMCSRHKV